MLKLRIHDLRHTYATRLRAVGVSEDDRADLLGHCSGRITRHYSAPNVQRLAAQAEKIVGMKREPVLRSIQQSPQNAHSG
jgi:integrase